MVKVKSTKTYKEVDESALDVDSDDLDEIQPPNLIKVWCNTQSILSFDEASADTSAPHIEKYPLTMKSNGWILNSNLLGSRMFKI